MLNPAQSTNQSSSSNMCRTLFSMLSDIPVAHNVMSVLLLTITVVPYSLPPLPSSPALPLCQGPDAGHAVSSVLCQVIG